MKIKLNRVGRRIIAIIKTVRWATGLSLREAKHLVDRAPVEFECSHRDAREVLADLLEDGADAELVGALCSCIHDPSVHDPRTGACLYTIPTFGPCPCDATPSDTRQALEAAHYKLKEVLEEQE